MRILEVRAKRSFKNKNYNQICISAEIVVMAFLDKYIVNKVILKVFTWGSNWDPGILINVCQISKACLFLDVVYTVQSEKAIKDLIFLPGNLLEEM